MIFHDDIAMYNFLGPIKASKRNGDTVGDWLRCHFARTYLVHGILTIILHGKIRHQRYVLLGQRCSTMIGWLP